ncbi:MAG: outer membrane protein transport protein [Desulfuromonadales bacterium]
MEVLRFIVLATMIVALMPLDGRSAGLWLYEQATPDMGLATAGRAALAQDASTASANPAGMTLLERDQLEGGLLGIFVTAKFDADSTTYDGGNGGDAGGFVPAGSFSYVHGLSPDLKLGVTMGSYFGLGMDYGDEWSGRYYIQEGELLTLGINPNIGYRVNDWLSIGAGVSILYGELNQEVAIINNPAGIFSSPDAKLKIESDDIGFGYNLGILVEPTKMTRFGLTYRSAVDLEFDDATRVENLSLIMSGIVNGILGPDRKVDMELTVPQTVMFSAFHQLNKQWAIMGNIGWQDQSEFGKTSISLASASSTSFTADRNFEDTWHYAIGTQYRFAPKWLLAVGRGTQRFKLMVPRILCEVNSSEITVLTMSIFLTSTSFTGFRRTEPGLVRVWQGSCAFSQAG